MVPRSAPKVTLEISHEKDKRVTKNCLVRHFGATWAILDDFGDSSKSEGAPKTTQKIEYGDFLAPLGGQKAEKGGFGRRLEKT